jgi:hypothetical protein
MTKIKAALIHLTISIIVIGLFVLLIFLIWYPQPLFDISGVAAPIKLLILIDVIIGPLLTFVVYKRNKKGLKFDLSVIALLQIAALSYGAYTIYNGKASILVMNNGEFHYLSEKFSENKAIKYDELQSGIFNKPQMGYITQLTSLDIYSSFSEIEPLNNYATMLLPHSFSFENIYAKFKGQKAQIQALENKYQGNDVVFFILDKEQVKHYVLYSKTENRIIDSLKF